MEAVVLCGIQGAGKTSLFVERFMTTHVRISRDLLRTPSREQRFLEMCLETRQPFVVDKVNATADDRRAYVEAAVEAGFRPVAWWVDAPARDAIARNAMRDKRRQVPVSAILGTQKRFEPPSLGEGFADVWRAWADGQGATHATLVASSDGAAQQPPQAEATRFTRDAAARR